MGLLLSRNERYDDPQEAQRPQRGRAILRVIVRRVREKKLQHYAFHDKMAKSQPI